MWWLGHAVFLLAMLAMAVASWWLAGLAMAPLLEAYRRQEQFSSDVAHELLRRWPTCWRWWKPSTELWPRPISR